MTIHMFLMVDGQSGAWLGFFDAPSVESMLCRCEFHPLPDGMHLCHIGYFDSDCPDGSSDVMFDEMRLIASGKCVAH